MRWRPALIFFATAAIIFFAGVAYGVLTVGVPSRDAAPESAAREAVEEKPGASRARRTERASARQLPSAE